MYTEKHLLETFGGWMLLGRDIYTLLQKYKTSPRRQNGIKFNEIKTAVRKQEPYHQFA